MGEAESQSKKSIFISFRYNEAFREAKLLQMSLERIGITSFVCEVPPGDNIKKTIVQAISKCDLVVILGTRTYGEKTQSSFSTYEEMEFVVDDQRPYFLIKMCDKFEIPDTIFNFRESVSYVKWTPSESIPSVIVPEIEKRLTEVVDRKKRELSLTESGIPHDRGVTSSSRSSDPKDLWLKNAFEYLSTEPHCSGGLLISQLALNIDRRVLSKDVKVAAILRSDPRFHVPLGQKIGSERVYLSSSAPRTLSQKNSSEYLSSLNTIQLNHIPSPREFVELASPGPTEISRGGTEDSRIDTANIVELNDDCELFVSGLEASANEESVRVFFNELSSGKGRVKRVTVKSPKGGGPLFAFVVFDDIGAAEKCVGRHHCTLGKIKVRLNEKERPPHASQVKNELIAAGSDPEGNTEQSNVSSQSVINAKIIEVSDVSTLDTACRYLRKTLSERQTSLAIDMHGVQLGKMGKISTVQLSCGNPLDPVFIVDAVVLQKIAFKEGSPLRILFEDDTVPKLFFDARGDVNALWHQFRIKIQNVEDLQLFDIVVRRKSLYSSLTDFIYHNQAVASTYRSRVKAVRNQAEHLYAQKYGGNYSVWMDRPLSPTLLEFAADVRFYNLMRSSFLKFTPAAASALQRATFRRLEHARGDEFSVTDDSNVKTEPLFLEELDKNTVLPLQDASVTISPDLDSVQTLHDCEVCKETFPLSRILLCNAVGSFAVKHAVCGKCLYGYAKDQMAYHRIGDGVLRCTCDRDDMIPLLRCTAKPWNIDQLSNALSMETMVLLLKAANTAVRVSPLDSVTSAPAVAPFPQQDHKHLTDCLNGSACSISPFCPYRHRADITRMYCPDWVVSRATGAPYCERGPACPWSHPYYKAVTLTDCPTCPEGARDRGSPCAYTGGLPSMLRHTPSLRPLRQRTVCRDFSPPPQSSICPRAMACPHLHLMNPQQLVNGGSN